MQTRRESMGLPVNVQTLPLLAHRLGGSTHASVEHLTTSSIPHGGMNFQNLLRAFGFAL